MVSAPDNPSDNINGPWRICFKPTDDGLEDIAISGRHRSSGSTCRPATISILPIAPCAKKSRKKSSHMPRDSRRVSNGKRRQGSTPQTLGINIISGYHHELVSGHGFERSCNWVRFRDITPPPWDLEKAPIQPKVDP